MWWFLRDVRITLLSGVVPPRYADLPQPDPSLTSVARGPHVFIRRGAPQGHETLLTNPDDETIRDYRPDAEPRVLLGSDILDLSDVLPGFTLVGAELFAVLTET